MAMLTDLVSYWPLDEASGNALDAHGTNELAEFSGTIGSTTGKVGGCRDFELADTEGFNLSDNADLSTGDIDFSLAVWVRAESLNASASIIQRFQGSGAREYELCFDGSRFAFKVSPTGTSTTVDAIANTFGAPAIDTWYLLIAWHDAVNNVLGISVNGTEDTVSHSGGLTDTSAATRIGFASSLHGSWDGLLDEVAFAKRVWTSDERTWIYNSGNGRSYADWVATETPSAAVVPYRGILTGSGLTARGILTGGSL